MRLSDIFCILHCEFAKGFWLHGEAAFFLLTQFQRRRATSNDNKKLVGPNKLNIAGKSYKAWKNMEYPRISLNNLELHGIALK